MKNILYKLCSADGISGSENEVFETITNSESIGEDLDYDIVLKVKPEKVSQIKSEVIDGKKYLVIPIDEDEQANVNGIDNLI